MAVSSDNLTMELDQRYISLASTLENEGNNQGAADLLRELRENGADTETLKSGGDCGAYGCKTRGCSHPFCAYSGLPGTCPFYTATCALSTEDATDGKRYGNYRIAHILQTLVNTIMNGEGVISYTGILVIRLIIVLLHFIVKVSLFQAYTSITSIAAYIRDTFPVKTPQGRPFNSLNSEICIPICQSLKN